MPDASATDPSDPQPDREDAFGELAREGYARVPGDHAAALGRLTDRIDARVTTETPVRRTGTAHLRRLPSPWTSWIAAAAALVLAISATLYSRGGGPSERYPLASALPLPDSAAPSIGEVATADLTAIGQATAPTDPAELPKPTPAREALADRAPAAVATAPQPGEAPLQATDTLAELVSVPAAATTGEPDDRLAARASSVVSAPTATPELEQVEAERGAAGAARNAETADAYAVDSDVADADLALPNAPLPDQALSAPVGEAASRRLERGPTPTFTSVRGCVYDGGEQPVRGALVQVERSGRRTATDRDGCFELQVLPGALVAEVTAEGFAPARFDLTEGSGFQITLSRSDPGATRVRLAGSATDFDPVDAFAPRYAAFDDFAAERLASAPGDSVVVSFEVTRSGRPRRVEAGPGGTARVALRAARELLLAGPDWPAAYRRERWRYAVAVPGAAGEGQEPED